MKLRPSLLTFLLLIASAAAPAMAGSASDNLNVSASVVPSIIIVPPVAPVPIRLIRQRQHYQSLSLYRVILLGKLPWDKDKMPLLSPMTLTPCAA
jgi:hypothetical protein